MGLFGLWSLTMVFGGLALLVTGIARLLRPGPVPRLRRGRAAAFALVGILFLAMPGIYGALTRPSLDNIQMTSHPSF